MQPKLARQKSGQSPLLNRGGSSASLNRQQSGLGAGSPILRGGGARGGGPGGGPGGKATFVPSLPQVAPTPLTVVFIVGALFFYNLCGVVVTLCYHAFPVLFIAFHDSLEPEEGETI